ncbi:MAG TPA: hypothetical protein VKI01_00095 [Acidimicrobiia bacterium]|nr:hypothetical protein [Acidimicrobiia bacterium]
MNVTTAGRVSRSFLATWFAVLGGIGAWLVHLTYAASVVELACEHPGWIWTIHGVTAVTALVTVVAIAMSAALVRESSDPESAGTRSGQIRFLGLMGLLVGGINLALILLEGSFAIFLRPCA